MAIATKVLELAVNKVVPMMLRRAVPRLFFLMIAAAVATLIASRAGVIAIPPRYDPFALPDLNETPYWLTATRLKLVDAVPENCSIALARTGRPVTLQPPKGLGTNCEREATVNLSRLSMASIRTEETRCNIAARLYMWERHALQPAALRYFKEPVTEILHFGSYSCRTIAGSSQMSEHASANAFDISGFKLRGGRIISVLHDWPRQSMEMKFLHVARDSACDFFNLVLSPDYNAVHRDHFHFDMGWLRGCR
jgi:hypothetical protein